MEAAPARSPAVSHRLAVALLVLLPGCLHVHTRITIDAPPEEVWDVLADTARYGEWNPYHVRVDGELVEGATLDVEIHKPNGDVIEIEPEVSVVDEPRELTWGGGVPLIFTGRHVFRLSPTDSGGTLLIQEEDFDGIAVPFAALDAIQEGYEQMNAALKARVEARR